MIAYIDSHGGDADPSRLRLAAQIRLPLRGRRRRCSKQLPIHYTAYGSRKLAPAPSRSPAGAPVEGGAHAEGDRHVLVVDKATCKLFELYRRPLQRDAEAPLDADAGVEWDLRSAALRPDGWTSADAAGLPIFPGLVRYEEAAAGRVDHAIR